MMALDLQGARRKIVYVGLYELIAIAIASIASSYLSLKLL